MPIKQRNLKYVFASCLLSSSILAPVFATPNWQGPYLGAYLGGGFGNNHSSVNAGSTTDTSYFTTSNDINSVNDTGTWIKSPSSVIVGIQAGHDWGWKKIIYGIALDYSTLPLSSSSTVNNNYPNNPDQYSVYTSMRTNWLFNLRGRVGYPTMLYAPSLLYLTGGMAMTQLKVSNSFSDNSALSGAGGYSTTQNQIGWTLGAGVEVAALKHVSVDFQYLYVTVPSVTVTSFVSNTQSGFGIPEQSKTSPLTTTGSFHANVFKIGVNYRFDE